MRLCSGPQDPDVRFCAPMAASAEARSAPSGVHPGRWVRRRGTWTESLRRGRAADKGFPFSRGPLPRGCVTRAAARLSCPPSLAAQNVTAAVGAVDVPQGAHGAARRPGRTQWPSRDGPADPGPGRLKGRIGRSVGPARSRATSPSGGARGSGGIGLDDAVPRHRTFQRARKRPLPAGT